MQDILLLLLRCLMLMLIAFLLATPFWQQQLKDGKAKGWVLIPQENFNEAYRHFKPAIDSFAKHGYELHYFNKGFTKVDLAEKLQHPGADSQAVPPANYWELTKQLERHIPQSLIVEVFTPNTLIHFTDHKPQTNLTINWHAYTPADSVSTFLSGAWLMVNGNIRVVQGTATPSGIVYQYNDIKNGGQSGSAYMVTLANGTPVVSFKNLKISVDTTTTRIAIYADKNTADANYLKAALDAAAQLSQHKIFIKIYNQPNGIPAGQNWLFWLTDKQVDAAIAKQTANLFQYQDGKITDLTSWMVNKSALTVTQGNMEVPLYKTISSNHFAGDAIWTNGFGNPVLTLETGITNTFHFYSRFNPAWNDLVWNDEFPKWLLGVTTEKAAIIDTQYDRRTIAEAQLIPSHIEAASVAISQPGTLTDLSHYLWLALALVFIIERWLANKNQTIPNNG